MQKNTLCILACSNYVLELKHVLKSIGRDDIKAKTYPAKCEDNCKRNDEVVKKSIDKYKKDNNDVCVLSCSTCVICNSLLSNSRGECQGKGLCFNFFLNSNLIQKYVEDGYYILTPGWLLKWKYYVLKTWAFDERTAKDFFKESANSLLLLDSGLYEGLEDKLIELSDFVGLPYEIIPVGLDYFKLYIEKFVNEWLFKEQKKETKRTLSSNYKNLANYVMAFDLISNISIVKEESEIISNILGAFTMIFAPRKMVYVRIVDDKIIDYRSIPNDCWSEDKIKKCIDFNSDYEWTESGKGFKLKISALNNLMGIVIIEDLQFPEYKDHYRKTSLYINQVCGLAISNARQFDKLKNTQNSLNQARELAEKANETKSKFLSIIAHDMKNPFNAILGFSDIIVKKFDQYDKQTIKTMISYIHESSQLMFELLQNLLMWSRSQIGSIEWNPMKVDLKKNILSNISILNISAENKRINISAKVDEKIEVFVDENMLNTIMRNLLSNAIKFTYENGNIQVFVIKEKDYAQITVKDNGVGMDKETTKKLFDMSQKHKRAGTSKEEGTGLGLLLCKEFVEKNNGKIWVESEPDKGSSFIFTLPQVNSK